MENPCTPFANKRVTQMGLGVLGRGIKDAAFLAGCGAKLTVTDLKDKSELENSLDALAAYDIAYTLGKHTYADFENRDFILKGAGVPLDSPYIAHAKQHGIPIVMDESLFAMHVPEGVTIIGVTGTRGKTTTASLIAHMLTCAYEATDRSVYLSGNVSGGATLPLLHTVQSGDVVVLELSSWQLQGFREAGISPPIAVFTNFMPDHLNYYNNDMDLYYKDKQAIYGNQKSGDVCIAGPSIAGRIEGDADRQSQLIVSSVEEIPADWRPSIRGAHNRENVACMKALGDFLGLDEELMKEAAETFEPVSGRLSFVQEISGIPVYNDNNATTPAATKAALESFPDGSVVLIMGGTDKGLSFDELYPVIENKCAAVVLYNEQGTQKIEEKIRSLAGISVATCDTLDECIERAFAFADDGMTVLFSPAFASFGRAFRNEYDREVQFLKSLKRYVGS